MWYDPAAHAAPLPASVGGTPIAAWLPGGVDPYNETCHPYDEAVALARRAQAGGGEIVAILWHQGESDASRRTEGYARVHRRLRIRFPNARLVFATTTPVLESGYATPERFYRRNADIEAFNAAARETLEPLGEEIDDLYRVMAPAPAAEHSDATHWNTEAGARRIGEAVLSCVRAALS